MTGTSVNDGIDAAFAELNAKGIVAVENPGFTMSDAWIGVNEIARGRSPTPRGATFYHGQDRARGIAGEGLLLAFGAFEDDDSKHDAKSIAIGREVCDTLKKHGVETEWDGTVGTRIRIPPFVWKKRGDKMASVEARMSAAEAGDLAKVRGFAKEHLDVRDKFGRTLLSIATENDYAEMVAWLLDAGAKPDGHLPRALFIRSLAPGADRASVGTNFSLLHIAAWYGAASVTKLLLERGFAVDARDLYGATPLIAAAMHDAMETIELLLAAGADPNACDVIGKTALDHASELDTVRRLLDAGASPDGGPLLGPPHAPERGERSWMRPLERFTRAGNAETAALLRARGAKDESIEDSFVGDLFHVAKSGNMRNFAKIMAGKPDLEARGEHGYTPLHWAAMGLQIEVVEALLAAGADPQAKDAAGFLPIQLAHAGNTAATPERRAVMDLLAKKGGLPAPLVPPPPAKPAAAVAGDTVSHATFGRGRVLAVKGDKLEVEFETAGKKTLIARVLTVVR